MSDDRWSRTAARLGELEESRRDGFTEAVREFVQPQGDEHALDLGTGTGALAFALAPYVADVLGVDNAPALLEEARRRSGDFPNVSFIEGDAANLDLRRGTFDLAGCSRVLHHVHRPEMVVASLARAIRFGGRVVVIDQIAPADPLVAVEVDRFERVRDPEHQRLLPDIDLRALLEANGLVVVRTKFTEEKRNLTWYLDLADCQGEARDRAEALAPSSPTATVGWYLAVKPQAAA
ncbi:MAG: class I SAM-dependent methyltransferase [Verrucomicrobiota bacterium]